MHKYNKHYSQSNIKFCITYKSTHTYTVLLQSDMLSKIGVFALTMANSISPKTAPSSCKDQLQHIIMLVNRFLQLLCCLLNADVTASFITLLKMTKTNV